MTIKQGKYMRKYIFIVTVCSAGWLSVAALPQNNNYSHLKTTRIAGKELFFQKKCQECHTLAETAEGELTPVTEKRSDD